MTTIQYVYVTLLHKKIFSYVSQSRDIFHKSMGEITRVVSHNAQLEIKDLFLLLIFAHVLSRAWCECEHRGYTYCMSMKILTVKYIVSQIVINFGVICKKNL